MNVSDIDGVSFKTPDGKLHSVIAADMKSFVHEVKVKLQLVPSATLKIMVSGRFYNDMHHTLDEMKEQCGAMGAVPIVFYNRPAQPTIQPRQRGSIIRRTVVAASGSAQPSSSAIPSAIPQVPRAPDEPSLEEACAIFRRHPEILAAGVGGSQIYHSAIPANRMREITTDAAVLEAVVRLMMQNDPVVFRQLLTIARQIDGPVSIPIASRVVMPAAQIGIPLQRPPQRNPLPVFSDMDRENVANITTMGFAENLALAAYIHANKDILQAVDILLSGADNIVPASGEQVAALLNRDPPSVQVEDGGASSSDDNEDDLDDDNRAVRLFD
jgi:hypothetical protein